MNYENSKTFYPQRLLFILSDKVNLKKTDEYVALSYQILSYATHGKIWKNCTKTINLKYQPQRGMKNWVTW